MGTCIYNIVVVVMVVVPVEVLGVARTILSTPISGRAVQNAQLNQDFLHFEIRYRYVANVSPHYNRLLGMPICSACIAYDSGTTGLFVGRSVVYWSIGRLADLLVAVSVSAAAATESGQWSVEESCRILHQHDRSWCTSTLYYLSLYISEYSHLCVVVFGEFLFPCYIRQSCLLPLQISIAVWLSLSLQPIIHHQPVHFPAESRLTVL